MKFWMKHPSFWYIDTKLYKFSSLGLNLTLGCNWSKILYGYYLKLHTYFFCNITFILKNIFVFIEKKIQLILLFFQICMHGGMYLNVVQFEKKNPQF